MLQGDREDVLLAAKEDLKAKVLKILEKHAIPSIRPSKFFVPYSKYEKLIKEIEEL